MTLDQVQQLQARERDLVGRELVNAQRSTELAEKERDLAQRQANTYKAMLESVTKKKGWRCGVKKVMTLGLGRCS